MASLSHSQRGEKERETGICCCGYFSNIGDLFQLCCITVLVLLTAGTGAQAVGSLVRHTLGVLGQIKSLPF